MALLGHQGTGDAAHDMKQFYEGPRGRSITRHEAVLRGTKGQESHTHGKKHFYEGPWVRRHIRKPETLHSGLLVGKHPTPSTGIRTPLPIGTGWGRYLPALLNSGFQDC